MNLTEVTNQVNTLANAWEHFKATNDQRLNAIEKKGGADILLDEQLRKLGDELDYCKNRLSGFETAMNRPDLSNIDAENYSEYRRAFIEYLRKGVESNLLELQAKSMSVGSDPDGGYLIAREISNNFIKIMHDLSPMRKLCNVETISTDSLELVEDYNQASAGWTSETAVVNDTATPKLGKKKISVHELYAQPKATQKLIDDANINIESWLVNKLVEVFSLKENESFINGDGAGKPMGILNYPAGKEWGKIERLNVSNLDGDALIVVSCFLKNSYLARASWLINNSAIQVIRQLKDNNGQYLCSPGLAHGAPNTILGLPVYGASEMPAVGKDHSTMIAVADFKAAYTIVDRIGIRVLRDPFTEKPFVKFYATKRVGGDVTNYEAIKLLSVGGK